MEKQVSSERIYSGRVIDLDRDEVMTENGVLSVRECVRANGGVAILAMIDQKVLLVKQYRYVMGEELIEIPAGKIELGEALEVCAARELEEETGYRADKLEKMMTFYPTPGFCGEKLHIYYADGLHKIENPKAMDEDECIELMMVDVHEVYQWIKEGKIRDSKTIIAIQQLLLEQTL